ncbi:hypothetical protein GOC91_21650 [Sinorhizobium medicae]|uniref:Uncharacterized protein n=2 Tax=Sinorhizobium medicae TaxID=110321 RepID=A0A508X016_9HYPH|nr:hypothetical protein [Sinorhizobium medicae]ABR62640.1 conserved hypothetical protein [Sinorhizobium medicae WSM419]MBO1942332.1 hypothetical protein [Sinorhizobium medicae]MBO1961352.1 hypothetical protein [Sinorhizobium medicae]MDX0406809.1 hypothetical protein [Sinorhizobium medicae]MDX0412357.1 hypothetical protein [Sinorhizobium medicae]
MWLRFSDIAMGDDEISMLRRVHAYACSFRELEPDSEHGAEVGKMLFHLYQKGVRSELALMQMLTAGDGPAAPEAG